jgi:hypothetical protein
MVAIMRCVEGAALKRGCKQRWPQVVLVRRPHQTVPALGKPITLPGRRKSADPGVQQYERQKEHYGNQS